MSERHVAGYSPAIGRKAQKAQRPAGEGEQTIPLILQSHYLTVVVFDRLPTWVTEQTLNPVPIS